jgi:hypothetical protein
LLRETVWIAMIGSCDGNRVAFAMSRKGALR